MKNKIISITEARKEIFKIANEVQKLGVYYTLTDRGRSKMVIMQAEEFDLWKETLEVQNIFPDLKDDLKKVKRDIETGEYKKYVTLEEVLAREGFVLADESNNKYKHEFSTKVRAKSRKKSGKNK